MSLRPEVDPDLCLSSGRCVADHPSAFAFDDDELAYALPNADQLDDGQVLEAARNCPAEAITVRDVDGNVVEFG